MADDGKDAETADAAPAETQGGYTVVRDEGHIVRSASPNLRLFVDRKLTVQEKDRDDYPNQTLFLDGVFSGAPFMDNERRHYALDHHAGCVRPFTLATCEQAAVMVMRGLPLGDSGWNIHINEPDLDALLASWVLLNHSLLSADGGKVMRDVMPLVRVEGIIDTHGLDMAVLSALPSHVYKLQKARLDALRAPEVELKETQQWEAQDSLSYVSKQLDRIDRQLLGGAREAHPPPAADRFDEVAWPQRRVAVLCRSTQGIYEVEEELKQSHGRSLGIIVLDRGGGRMTLLQVDPFMQKGLSELYPMLNERDPASNADTGNVWGGSAEIGGTPRETGTSLTGKEVLETISGLFGAKSPRPKG